METLRDLFFIALGTLFMGLHAKGFIAHWWALRRANRRALADGDRQA